jgi:hypothetical protein
MRGFVIFAHHETVRVIISKVMKLTGNELGVLIGKLRNAWETIV